MSPSIIAIYALWVVVGFLMITLIIRNIIGKCIWCCHFFNKRRNNFIYENVCEDCAIKRETMRNLGERID